MCNLAAFKVLIFFLCLVAVSRKRGGEGKRNNYASNMKGVAPHAAKASGSTVNQKAFEIDNGLFFCSWGETI